MNNWQELSVELVCLHKGGNLSVIQNGTSSQKPFENFKAKGKKKRLGLIELDPLRPPSPHPSMLSEMYGCIIQWALLYLWGARLSGWEAASSYRRSPAVLRQARQRCTLGCAHTLCQNTLFLLDNLRVTLCAVCRPSHRGKVRIPTPVTPPRGPSCPLSLQQEINFQYLLLHTRVLTSFMLPLRGKCIPEWECSWGAGGGHKTEQNSKSTKANVSNFSVRRQGI